MTVISYSYLFVWLYRIIFASFGRMGPLPEMQGGFRYSVFRGVSGRSVGGVAMV